MDAVGADLQKLNLEAQGNLQTDFTQHRFDLFIEDHTTILGNAHQMIK